MTTPLDVVKKVTEACVAKDFDSVRPLLHPAYSCSGPYMECHSPDELIENMKSCPFESRIENIQYISEGNRVVQTFDWICTSPVAFSVNICDILTVENGKLRSERLFYDTAALPREALDIMKGFQTSFEKAA